MKGSLWSVIAFAHSSAVVCAARLQLPCVKAYDHTCAQIRCPVMTAPSKDATGRTARHVSEA